MAKSYTLARSATNGPEGRGLVSAAYLAVYRSARLVQLHLPGIAPRTAKRSKVYGFSEDSRRRLLQLLHSIKRDVRLPIMLTLTFPEELTLTAAEAKDCLRAMLKRIEVRHPEMAAVWRIEAHPEMSARLGRVHPHFHLLMWGAWLDLAWLGEAWASVVWSVLEVDECLADASGELVRAKAARAGTNAERVRKWAGVSYCAKTYLAKDEEYPLGEAGRVWGWHARERLPLDEPDIIHLGALAVASVTERVKEWMAGARIASEHMLRTFFDEQPSDFAARLLKPMALPRWFGRLPWDTEEALT